jgi:hypothetical protein
MPNIDIPAGTGSRLSAAPMRSITPSYRGPMRIYSCLPSRR